MRPTLILFAISLLVISAITAQSKKVPSMLTESFDIGFDSVFCDLADLDQPPSFPGGQLAWGEYLMKSIKNSPIYKEENISTWLNVRFIVEKDGSISHKRVLSTKGPLLQVILGAIDQMPCWSPAIINGQPVRFFYYWPIRLCLE